MQELELRKFSKISSVKVLDLFCGMGGLSLGFSQNGFSVTGVDIKEAAKHIFHINKIGKFIHKDLSEEYVSGRFDVIIGGPPCRPWSSLNIKKRKQNHNEIHLLDKFFEHVAELKPDIFVVENVPAIKNYDGLLRWIRVLRRHGYSIDGRIIIYSEWGASTGRRRFFLIGIRTHTGRAVHVWEYIERFRRKPGTVRDAIYCFMNKTRGEIPDHDWPELKTIDRYMDKYRSRKFGWYILEWDKPAPSFGNIMKTYILHPSSLNGGPRRVISIREAMAIMGFDLSFRFPEGMGMSPRYQMVADSVSPVFSRILARAVHYILAYTNE